MSTKLIPVLICEACKQEITQGQTIQRYGKDGMFVKHENCKGELDMSDLEQKYAETLEAKIQALQMDLKGLRADFEELLSKNPIHEGHKEWESIKERIQKLEIVAHNG